MANGWLLKTSKRVGKKISASISTSMSKMWKRSKPHRGSTFPENKEGESSSPVWYTKSLKQKFLEDEDDEIRKCHSDPETFIGNRAPLNGPDAENFKLLELQHYIYRIVWNYFVCLVLLNTIFAVCVFLLLLHLAVDLSAVIAVLCFLLSFIPELGALISLILPLPFVLLTPTEHCTMYHMGKVDGVLPDGSDCIADFNDRLTKLLLVGIGMLAIKFLVANMLNAVIMGKNKVISGAIGGEEEVSETHGVLVLFAVVFFGKIWGTVGMLLSVPILSIIRLTINMGTVRGRQKAKKGARRSKDSTSTGRQTFIHRFSQSIGKWVGTRNQGGVRSALPR